MANLSTTSLAQRCYRLHGFVVDSELEFPELVRDDGVAAPEVAVRFGQVPSNIENPRQSGVCFQACAGEMLLWLEGVARFHVRDGRTITIERGAAASDDAIRSLALSSPLAALLLQRGLLTLHASAITTPQGAVVFVGAAAQGKSTLAAKLAQSGSGVMSDDLTALDVGERGTHVLPGYPLVRLWPDALTTMGFSADVPPVRPGIGKRLLACPEKFPNGPVPLVAIYVLEHGEMPPDGKGLTRLTRKEALVTLLDAVYRPAFVRGLHCEQAVFSQVGRLVHTTRVARAFVPADRFDVGQLASQIMEDLES